MKDPEFTKQIHFEVARSLDQTPNSIRKLEEKTNHLFKSKDFFQLKQTLSSIETFLLLFNAFTKYDLCRYWQTLEEAGYDPVVEYNKGLELFDMHYSPKAEDLFTIILQISRFLKEFTDFETKFTPEFRHPFVKGKIIQLKSGQTKNDYEGEDEGTSSLMNIFKVSKDRGSDMPNNENMLPFKEDDIEVSTIDDDDLDAKDKTEPNKINFLEDIGLYSELYKLKMTGKNCQNVIEGHERYNVDVPSGRVKFMEHFKDIINQKKIKKNYNVDPSEMIMHDFIIDEEKVGEEHARGNKLEINQFQTSKTNNKDMAQQIIDDIDLTIEPERKGSFYYYKRWIWMIFPWVCMSVNKKQTFSELISKCYSSNIRYLSVEEEQILTKHAIKIVIESKMKRKMMYAKKAEEEDNLKTQKTIQSQVTKGAHHTQQSDGNGSQMTLIDDQRTNSIIMPKKNETIELAPINHKGKNPMIRNVSQSNITVASDFFVFTEVKGGDKDKGSIQQSQISNSNA